MWAWGDRKGRAMLWAGLFVVCLTVVACTRQTSGNPSTNQAQSQGATPSPGSGAAEEKAAATPAAPASPPATPSESVVAPNAIAPSPTPAAPVVLPAGTVLNVRISNAIEAGSAQQGQTFQGVLAQPITHNGRTAIPAGASVTGTIVSAKQGGKIKGESTLALQLTSIRVRGISYPVVTSQYVQEQKGKGGRTAKMGAGGAAGGAIIGGIAGGGKGAAIGSVVGGGAGVAGSAMTGNKALTIPAETVLQFKLAQPVKLTSQPAPNPDSGEPNH